MSRGFVKEDDQEENIIIPPRAVLPEGVVNYVTPTGMKLLLQEMKTLKQSRKNLNIEDENQRRRELALIDGQMNLLQERILSARILEWKEQLDEIRFGATVKIMVNNHSQKFTIVGVDESNVNDKKISFLAPIARVITGKKAGDEIDFKLGEDTRKIKILEIHYY